MFAKFSLSEKRWIQFACGLFGLAALIHLTQILTEPWACAYPDSFTFLEPIRQILTGGEVAARQRRTWGYPAFLWLFSKTSYPWFFAVVGQHMMVLAAQALLMVALFRYFLKRHYPLVFAVVASGLFLFNDKTFFYGHSILSDTAASWSIEICVALAIFLLDANEKARRWLGGALVVSAMITVLIRPQLLVFFLPLVVIWGVFLSEYRFLALALLIGLLGANFLNSRTTIIGNQLPILATAVVSPYIDLHSGVEQEVKEVIGPITNAYREEFEKQQGALDSVNLVFYPVDSRMRAYFTQKGSLDPDRDTSRALWRIAAETYWNHPLQVFEIHRRKIWDFWYHMGNTLDSDPYTMSKVPQRYWTSENYKPTDWSWRGNEITVSRAQKNIWRETARLIQRLALNRFRRFIQVILFLLMIPLSLRVFRRSPWAREAALVSATLSGIAVYSLQFSVFNSMLERYNYPVQSAIFACAAISTAWLWNRIEAAQLLKTVALRVFRKRDEEHAF